MSRRIHVCTKYEIEYGRPLELDNWPLLRDLFDAFGVCYSDMDPYSDTESRYEISYSSYQSFLEELQKDLYITYSKEKQKVIDSIVEYLDNINADFTEDMELHNHQCKYLLKYIKCWFAKASFTDGYIHIEIF